MVLWTQQDSDSYEGAGRLDSKLIHMGGGGWQGTDPFLLGKVVKLIFTRGHISLAGAF